MNGVRVEPATFSQRMSLGVWKLWCEWNDMRTWRRTRNQQSIYWALGCYRDQLVEETY